MAEMSAAQFQVVADLMRSREPVRTAASMVLVGEHTTKAAAEKTGLVSQAVSNALRRYRCAHARLLLAYTDIAK